MPIRANAYAAPAVAEKLEPWSFDRRDPNPDDVVIDIKFSGLCHSDWHFLHNDLIEGPFPMVPGHEITGLVRAVGAKVADFKVGDRVGVGTFVDACGTCGPCADGDGQYCLEGATWTYGFPERDARGGVTYGGHSDVIVVKANHVVRVPDALPLDKAAPLLCAGGTSWSVLRHWAVGPGSRVAVLGMGGVGHVAVKLAVALGAEVTVISQTAAKKDDARLFGAKQLIATKENPDFARDHARAFDLILNTVSSPLPLDPFLEMLRLNGAMVNVGLPPEPMDFRVRSLIAGRRSLAASGPGSVRENQEVLDFCAAHGVVPEIELVHPARVNDGYERMVMGDVRYRFVMDMSKLGEAEVSTT